MLRHSAHRAARGTLALMLASLLAFGPVFAFAAPSGPPDLPPHAADRFLVKFSSKATGAAIQILNARHGVRELDRIDPLGVRVMSVPRGRSAEALARAYSTDSNVVFAEPDYVVQASLIPNDTYYLSQWAMPKISAPTAWDTTTGSPAVKIAIVDTGVDSSQPDLAGRVVAGFDYVNGDSNPSDDNGHGTMCAGVAGANGNNSLGVAGMDWAARLLAVKVLDSTGSGYVSNVAKGITYAASSGARVISMSLGARASSSSLQLAVNYAYGKGSLLVAASGNDASNSISYPAACANVMAVGATDSNDVLASFSNYGPGQDVVAPGVSIATTHMGGSYVYFSGTSAATPFVAGTAGLVLARNPGLTNAAAESAIRAGVDDLGVAGWDQTYGWGRVDAAGAVAAAGGSDLVTILSASASPNPATVGQAVTFTASASDSLSHAISYQWTEGTTVLSNAQTFSTSLLTVGTHAITVKATCSSGAFATRTISVTVNSGDQVRTTLTISGPTGTVKKGETFTLSGTLTAENGASTAGQVVSIQALMGASAVTLGKATVSSSGTWSYSVVATYTMIYRAVFAGSGGFLPSASGTVLVWVN